MKKKTFNQQDGFNLIELVVVVCVIAVIALIAAPMLRRSIVKANDAAAVSAMRVISQGENVKFYSTGSYFVIGKLRDEDLIDKRFGGLDPNATEATHSGYEFRITLLPPTGPTEQPNYLLTAHPTRTNFVYPSGSKRFGMDKAGAIFYDDEVIDDHFQTVAEVYAAKVFGNQ